MQLPLIQIDAFADRLFAGNPAAVMPLTSWLPDALLQDLALENNLSETAFLVAELPADATPATAAGPTYHLRWFTPAIEVDLCGHATLAAAAYLLDDVHPDAEVVGFWTRSGWLSVRRDGPGRVQLDFPAPPLTQVQPDPEVTEALGSPPQQAMQSMDLIYVYADAEQIRALRPDGEHLSRLAYRGVCVTAPGAEGVDFVSRFFGCAAGVGEDPVTGSAHAQLAPWWAERLGRTELVAHQLSARGGRVDCVVTDDGRVLLSGRYARYLTGVVTLP